MSKLTSIAKDLLIINEDFEWRHRDENHNTLNQELFDLYIFEQVWPDTSCGFGGIAGQAFTSSNVYAFVPKNINDVYFVNIVLPVNVIIYIGNRFAYSVPKTDQVLADIKNKSILPVYEKDNYIK